LNICYYNTRTTLSTEREYRSSLREEQARQTRARIRAAARELFTEEGFAAATVASIARRAGVSSASIYATYGSKAGIVSAMVEEMEEAAGIGQRLAAVFAEPDPHRQLRLFVAAHTALFAGGADVLRAALRAAETPEVAALAERGDSNRRAVIERLVGRWAEAGALGPGLAPEDAAERVWLLTTTESFLSAVDRLGWSAERYETWLGTLLEREILGKQSA
jgi:AcrR family transcriptional regulator